MADNNIFIRIRGEADLGDAQSQIRELTDRNKELEAQIKRVTKAEQEDAESIRQMGLAGDKLQAALKRNEDYYKKQKDSLDKLVVANNKSVASLKQSVNQYNAVNGAGVKLRTQLMAIREEMVRLAEAGDTTSNQFIQLADRAAELTDTIGDAQQIINILASDTGNLDTALQVGGGLAGAFNAATSAAALLGGESEELQQAFLKVQAALSVLNGIQQVAAVLDKRSAANVKIRLALAKLFNKEKTKEAVTTGATAAATGAHAAAMTTDAAATTAATVATKGFTAALLANPVGAILAGIVALAAGVYALYKAFNSDAASVDAFNEKMSGIGRTIDRQNEKLENMKVQHANRIRMMEAEGATEGQIHNQKVNDLIEEEQLARELYESQKNAYAEAVKERNRILNSDKSDRKKNKLIEESHLTDEDIEALRKKAVEAYRVLATAKTDSDVEMESWNTQQDKKNQEALDKALQKRTERLMQQVKDENIIKQVLNNLNPNAQGSYDEDGQYWTNQEKALIGLSDAAKQADDALKGVNEREEEVNLASYESLLDLRLAGMQAEGASDEEMWNVKYTNMMNYLQRKKDALYAQLGEDAQYSQEMVDIDTQMTDLQIANRDRLKQKELEKQQETMEIAMQTLDTLGNIMGEVFGAISDNIQTQMDDLNNLYTTDAEEAKENANKKYISEKELADKQLKLKQKQAKLDKANALFNIGLNTAMAIMRIWADVPKADFGATTIALTALVSALGATQLAVAAAKPLPKYEKGRKGGKGEYALVGEKGPELMYVPAGASIVPNNKMGNMAAWADYGVPKLNIPASAANDMITSAMMMQAASIDYDRLGKAVANAMPQQKAVSVNVDRNGVTISDNGNRRTYLNHKYAGSWS